MQQINEIRRQILEEIKQEAEDLQFFQSRPFLKDGEKQVKDFRWQDQEHILYLIFLENNKERLKSKLIRRSNNFFNEMSEFIKSKSGTQCRSHHQKYQTKYKYPHRIIKQEKRKMNSQLYVKIQENPDCFSVNLSLEKKISSPVKKVSDKQSRSKARPKKENQAISAQFACQTDLAGVENYLEMWNGQVNPRFQENNKMPFQALMHMNHYNYWAHTTRFNPPSAPYFY